MGREALARIRSLRKPTPKMLAYAATTAWPRRRSRVGPVAGLALMIAAGAAIAVIGVGLVGSLGTSTSPGVRHPVSRLHTPALHHASGPLASVVRRLRVISYYPAWHPWGGTWAVWQPSVLGADMARIASLGANTVRVFVQPATFGYPIPQPAYVARLGEFLSIAAAHRLKVWLNLFDGWSAYTDLAGSQGWAAQLLAPFHADPRIAVVELQSEIDPVSPVAMAWAHRMLPVIRADSARPVTVSVTGWNTARPLAELIAGLGSSRPDFYDLHFYGTPPYMFSTFASAQRMVADKPLVIGETGYSTDPGNASWLGSSEPVAVQERAQARYLAEAEVAARVAGLPPVGVWTLNDFPPALLHVTPAEQHFGLYRLDGTAKPAAAVVRRSFGG